VGLGKFGGRELNYHSDLDLIFVHEGDGWTDGAAESVPNEVFLTEVIRRSLKMLAGTGANSAGPLYSVDTRLRPHGASGPLVVPLEALREYFRTAAQIWEWLALARARVIYSNGGFGRVVSETIRALLARPVDPRALARKVVAMRRKLEETPARTRLKRGYGGLADIEFLVHYLQLVHAAEYPEVLRPNLWEALDALCRRDLLTAAAHSDLVTAYDFLRTVESRLRIVHNRSGVDLPDDAGELVRLARRLSYEANDPAAATARFRAEAARHAERTRALFQQVVGQLAEEEIS
jgi:glutamate-ammonia-ligase adenylyltransferase